MAFLLLFYAMVVNLTKISNSVKLYKNKKEVAIMLSYFSFIEVKKVDDM